MPNISITRRCSRGCAYCFASYERARDEAADMPRDIYEKALAFLKRSGIHDARLLGGEPTEHPAFREYVALALDRGFDVTLFTGGLMPDSSLECLCGIPPNRIIVVLNAVVPGLGPPEWVAAQDRVCRMLGEKVELGLTMDSPACNPFFLLDWIDNYSLRHRVRLGIAHPIVGATNASLRPQSVHVLGNRLVAFVDKVEEAGVEIDFDCGFTPCMFSHDFMVEHAAAARAIGSRCNPIIDILPEGVVIACYPLSCLGRMPLTNGSTRDELVSRFEEELNRLLPDGAYRDCALCKDRLSGYCDGGCRARRALRLRPAAVPS